MKDTGNIEELYFESCQKEFWQKVFQCELAYLIENLKGCRDVLSVGCGPAIIEGELEKHGYTITGLDISQEALNRAPDQIRTVAARAEDLPFPESSFDAVIYVVSLQFVENYRKAIERTTSVLRPKGTLLVMLLNPGSDFFKRKLLDANSYVNKIKHTELSEIERVIAENYTVHGEYLLGVRGDALFASPKVTEAVLYILRGTKKQIKKYESV